MNREWIKSKDEGPPTTLYGVGERKETKVQALEDPKRSHAFIHLAFLFSFAHARGCAIIIQFKQLTN